MRKPVATIWCLLFLLLGSHALAQEEKVVLPGTAEYIRQDTEELIALARARDLRKKAVLYARFATRRAREIARLAATERKAEVESLFRAYALLSRKGADKALRAGGDQGLDLREAYESVAQETRRQKKTFEKLAGGGTVPGDKLTEVRQRLATRTGELEVLLRQEKNRMEVKLRSLDKTFQPLAKTLAKDFGFTKEKTKAFRTALFAEVRDHKTLHVGSIRSFLHAAKPYVSKVDGKTLARLSSRANQAGDHGLTATQTRSMTQTCLDRGLSLQDTGKTFTAASRYLSKGKGENRGEEAAFASTLTERLLKSGQPVAKVFAAFRTCQRAKKAGMKLGEMQRTLTEEFQKKKGMSIDTPEGLAFYGKATKRFLERLNKRSEELDKAFERASKRLEKLKEWLERKRRMDKTHKDKDKDD